MDGCLSVSALINLLDPAPVAADFNEQDYATLVAHPPPFRKFPEEFMCLVGLSHHYTLDEETYPRFLDKDGEDMDIFAFIHTPDPTKVKVVERERREDEPQLLETTVGRTVPLLLVAPDRAGSDRNVRGKGRLWVLMLRFLVGAVLNAEVRGEVIPTLPFVTAFVSATPERKGANVTKAEVDSLVRSTVSIMTTVTTVVPTVDSSAVAKEKTVKPLLFGAFSSSAGGTDPTPGGFFDRTGSDFLVGGIRTVIDPDSDLQKVYIPQWNVTNGPRLDDGGVCRGMVDEFAPSKFFASIRGMEHDQLFNKFNARAASQISLRAKVRMRAEYNIKEKRRLKSVVKEKDVLLKARDEEIENLMAQLLLKEAEAAKAIRLRAEASKFKSIEKSLRDEMKALEERNTTFEKEKNDLNVKVTDLTASVAVGECEVADLDTLVTSVESQNDKLVDHVHELELSSFGLQEKLSNYENLTERLEEFQDAQLKIVNDKFEKLAAIGKAVEKGMQDGLLPELPMA
ncbi:hypothetical protein Tco_1024922 [Tanacetum coccineum]